MKTKRIKYKNLRINDEIINPLKGKSGESDTIIILNIERLSGPCYPADTMLEVIDTQLFRWVFSKNGFAQLVIKESNI